MAKHTYDITYNLGDGETEVRRRELEDHQVRHFERAVRHEHARAVKLERVEDEEDGR